MSFKIFLELCLFFCCESAVDFLQGNGLSAKFRGLGRASSFPLKQNQSWSFRLPFQMTSGLRTSFYNHVELERVVRTRALPPQGQGRLPPPPPRRAPMPQTPQIFPFDFYFPLAQMLQCNFNTLNLLRHVLSKRGKIVLSFTCRWTHSVSGIDFCGGR